MDELIARMDEAGAVIDRSARELDHAAVADGFEDENAQLVTTLRSYSPVTLKHRGDDEGSVIRSVAADYQQLELPGVGHGQQRSSRSSGARESEVPPLYRHGGVE